MPVGWVRDAQEDYSMLRKPEELGRGRCNTGINGF